MGRNLRSDGRADGRQIGESDLIEQGRRQVRRAWFINNGRVSDIDEHKKSWGVISSKDRIEAKYSKKALRWAYK